MINTEQLINRMKKNIERVKDQIDHTISLKRKAELIDLLKDYERLLREAQKRQVQNKI